MDDLAKLKTGFEQELNNFYMDTIKEYKTQIAKYSLIVDSGKAVTKDYANLFNAYVGLYKFSQHNKNAKVSKTIVDDICNKLMAYIKKDIVEGNSKLKAEAYTYLANVCIYRKKKKKAMECYNKAVSIDKSFLMYRADFRNIAFNDREGALKDYNDALTVVTDPETIELIKFSIQNIDALRHANDTLKNVKMILFKSILIITVTILLVAAIVYFEFFK